jgi:hypothetical protein
MESTSHIFKSLGFAIPSTDYVAATATKELVTPSSAVVATLLDFWKRHFTTMLAVILASGVSAIFLNNNGSNNSNSLNQTATAKTDIPVVSSSVEQAGFSVHQSGIAATEKKSNIRRSSFNSSPSATVASGRNSIPVQSEIAMSDDNASSDATIESPSDSPALVILSNSGIISNNAYSNIRADRGNIFVPSSSDFQGFNLTSGNRDYSIQLRRLGTSSVTSINLPAQSNSILANWGLGITRKLDNNFSIGIEIGSEQFAQNFKSVSQGENMVNRQNPLMFWYGGLVRYNYNLQSFGNMLTPFAQIFAGGTSVGFLARPQIGVVLNPYRFFNLSLGAEAAYMWYNVQGTSYRTDKYGLTIGAGINF